MPCSAALYRAQSRIAVMYFKELELVNFRNYEKLKIRFHEKVNILLGENAQGKTNLLEALYIMSLGKSFRTSRDSDMIRFGTDFARIRTVSEKEGEDLIVEIGLIRRKKSLKIDGVKKKKISDLLENVYIVIFSPDDLRIVKDEPEKRRRFIDRELCQLSPVYYDDLVRYRKALNQRNVLLREERPDASLMDIWDEETAFYGSRIMVRRKAFSERLRVISRKIHGDLTEGREELDVFYEPDIPLAENPPEQRKQYLQVLREGREKDAARRTTLRGPHRDDLGIKTNGTDVRNYGSQGQQRTAALSLKLAELTLIEEETGEKPVLLLDDVLSELDRTRQRQLITSFGDIQIFITATELDSGIISRLSDYTVFQVERGIVRLSGGTRPGENH